MNFTLLPTIGFALATMFQAPALLAQDSSAQQSAANIETGQAIDLDIAHKLVINAVKPLVDSDYPTADPLLLEAKALYEKQAAQYAVSLDGESDGARANELGRLAYKAFKNEDWEKSAFLYFYQSATWSYGRGSLNRDSFDRWDADRLAPLALILYKTGDEKNASVVLRAILGSRNQDVRETVIMEFNTERFRLSQKGEYLEAKAIAEFAVQSIDNTLADNDPAALSLKDSYSAMLLNTGETDKGLRYAQGDMAPDSMLDDGEQVSRLITAGRLEDAISKIEQFRRAQGDAKSESLGHDLTDALQWVPINLVDIRINGYKRALSIYQQTSGLEASASLRTIFALGNVYTFVGDYANAEKTYRDALAITEKHLAADAPYNLDALSNLASSLNALGKTTEAKNYYQRAWHIMHSLNDYTYEETSGTAGDLIKHMLRIGELEDADKLSQYVLSKARKTNDIDESSLVNFLSIRAATEMRLKNYSAANKLLIEALELLERQPGGEYSRVQITAYSNLAYSLEAQSRHNDATDLRRKADDAALNNAIFGPTSLLRLETGRALASNLSKAGKKDEAEELFRKLLTLSQNVYGDEHEITITIASSLAHHYFDTAEFDNAFEMGLLAYDGSIAILDKAAPSVSDEDYREMATEVSTAAWLVVKAGLNSTTDKADKAKKVFEALQMTEMSSAGLAFARNSQRSLAQNAGALTEYTEWQNSKRDLAFFDKLAVEAQTDKETSSASSQRKILAIRTEQTREALADKFPEFFNLVQTAPVSLDSVIGNASLLRSDEALIIVNPGKKEGSLTDNNGIVFVATREGWFTSYLKVDQESLSASIAKIHRALSGPGSGETLADGLPPPLNVFNRNTAFDLHQTLFNNSEIAGVLAEKKQWTIAPQGIFLSLPFSALVTEKPKGGAAGDIDPNVLRKTKWLGLEKALTFVPSIKAIDVQRNRKAQNRKGRESFFGLGDPAFQGSADRPIVKADSLTRSGNRSTDGPSPASFYYTDNTANLENLAKLERLEGTDGEVRSLAKLLNAEPDTTVFQLNATEAELNKRNASGRLAEARIIVFATHGLLSGENSTTIVEPSLALTPPTKVPGQMILSENDGLLTSSEAALLNLNADMVILSACNTAAGGTPGAEGLSGLTKAFLHAGARSLLVSHFPVFDFAAPKLTFEALKLEKENNLSAALAMQMSMQKMFEDPSNDYNGYSFSHPKAWASFVLIDGR